MLVVVMKRQSHKSKNWLGKFQEMRRVVARK